MSRSTRKQERREALMRGARAVLTSHGLEGFTTGRVAKEAGIAQSGFYVYFPDRDTCLEAVAAEIGAEILAVLQRTRQQEAETGMLVSFGRTLSVLAIEHRPTVELFLRFRREPGPLGDVFRGLLDRALVELHTDMVAAGHVTDDAKGRRMARYTLSVVLGSVEAMLDGHIDDVDAVALELTSIAAAALSMGVTR